MDVCVLVLMTRLCCLSCWCPPAAWTAVQPLRSCLAAESGAMREAPKPRPAPKVCSYYRTTVLTESTEPLHRATSVSQRVRLTERALVL